MLLCSDIVCSETHNLFIVIMGKKKDKLYFSDKRISLKKRMFYVRQFGKQKKDACESEMSFTSTSPMHSIESMLHESACVEQNTNMSRSQSLPNTFSNTLDACSAISAQTEIVSDIFNDNFVTSVPDVCKLNNNANTMHVYVNKMC